MSVESKLSRIPFIILTNNHVAVGSGSMRMCTLAHTRDIPYILGSQKKLNALNFSLCLEILENTIPGIPHPFSER